MNTPLHGSPTHRYHRNTGGSIVRVLNATASKLRRAARLARDNPTRRKLLQVLATEDGGVMYPQLFAALPVSERWVREIVADLRREGIVETPGNPALIQFTSRDVQVAVKELVAFLASEWVDTITREDARSRHTALSLAPALIKQKQSEDYLKAMVRLLRGEGG